MREIEYPKIGRRYAHVLIAEAAVGRKLPRGSCVHHADGDGTNNEKTNLVICPSQAYHKLLHVRMNALNESGHVDWRKCVFCKKYDSPQNLVIKSRVYHGICARLYYKGKRDAKRPPGWVWIPGSQNIGRRRGVEHNAKLMAAHTGRKCSPETIEKMRIAALMREARKREAA